MQDMQISRCSFIEQERPVLGADIAGDTDYPDIKGTVYVYALSDGVYVKGELEGLPKSRAHAVHVHSGTACKEVGERLLTLPDITSGENGRASARVQLDGVAPAQIAGKPIVIHIKEEGKEKQMIACGILAHIL